MSESNYSTGSAAKRNWWTAAPGWPTLLCAITLFILLCWTALWPVWPLRAFIFGVLWFIVLLLLMVRWISRQSSLPPQARTMTTGEKFRWSFPPVLFAIALVLLLSGQGYRIGFAFSRGPMDRLLQRALVSPQHHLELNEWVGLYQVERVNCSNYAIGKSGAHEDWSCEVVLADSFLGNSGFYYLPKIASYKPETGETSLGGGWYSWRHFPT
jgi:hypothetical protein